MVTRHHQRVSYLKVNFRELDVKSLKEWCGLRIWEKPDPGAIYCVGADVAEGVGKDASVAQVIKVEEGIHIASFWSNVIDPDNFAAELVKLGYYYNTAQIIPEENSAGLAVISHLSGNLGGYAYPNLYRRRYYDEYAQKETQKIGFRTNQQTKSRILENLKAAFRDGKLVTYDKELRLEMGSFKRDEKTGKLAAKGNAHDDRVMAMALAWEGAMPMREAAAITSATNQPQMQFDPVTGFPTIF